MQTTNSISELIRQAVSKGFTRSQLAELVGCSRMQLWRLEKGLVNGNSAVARHAVDILQEIVGAPLHQTLLDLSKALAASDPDTREITIQLLHNVTTLLRRD